MAPGSDTQQEVTIMGNEIVDLRVGNLMTLDPIVVDPEALVSEAERLLKTYRVSGLPVVEGGEVIGVISQSDLVVARSSDLIGGHWERLRVRHLMTTPAITVHTTATLRYAARQMVSRHIHRLVVVGDDGHPIGVLTPLDLLRAFVQQELPVPLS